MAIPAICSQGYNGYYVNQAPVADEGRTSAAASSSAPSFRAQPERDIVELSNKKEKKKSNAAAWGILGAVATIGAAVLCKKAYNIGGKMKSDAKWYQKIGMGSKSLFRFNPKNIKTEEQLKDANWFTQKWHGLKGRWNKWLAGIGKKAETGAGAASSAGGGGGG